MAGVARLRSRSIIFGFWFLILGLVAARVAYDDQIVAAASQGGTAIAPSITATASRPG